MERMQSCRPVVVLVLVVGIWTQCGTHGCSCGGESVPRAPVLSGPERVYLGKRVVLRCAAPGPPRPGAYQLLKGPRAHPTVLQTLEGDHPANFTLVVRPNSGGIYHCRARAGADSGSYSPSSNAHSLHLVTPVRGARLLSDPDPAVVWEGGRLVLRCEVRQGSYLSYRWYFNRTELPPPAAPPPGERTLVLHPVSEQHAGRYYCAVRNDVRNSQTSNSLELELRVKVFLSEPQISFSVTKEEWGYRADVRCWSSRGSPPVRFWLGQGDRVLANQTSASLSAVFSVPVSIGRSHGLLRCGAGNHGNQELLSNPLNLEVVPVGGAVRLQAEHLYSADSEAVGVALRCIVGRGTFPEYAWFRNHTLLPRGGDSYVIAPEGHTLILPVIAAGNSGYYHCQAKDNFDNTSWVVSAETLVHKTDQRLVSSEVIAVSFCCFLLLVLVGSVCWIFTLTKRHVDVRVRRRSSAAAPAAPTSGCSNGPVQNTDPTPAGD